MTNLGTRYLGLNLKSPLVISSSGLSNTLEKVQKLEESGAAAIVLKSLFEEQIRYEAGMLEKNADYTEAADYIFNYTKNNTLEQYINLIEASKSKVNIPIIPSINCVSSDEWVMFAKDIENAGADGLEINVYLLPTKKEYSANDYEKIYLETIENIAANIRIPLAVKLGRNFTNPANMVNQLYKRGVKGVVLFNRFYEPDIDIDSQQIVSSEVFSSPMDIRQSLRWVAIISSLDIKVDIAASTGIHNGADVIKQLLAGANIAMICSTIYKNGVPYIKTILDEVTSWMEKNNYESISDFRGKLSYKDIPEPEQYERSQFMKYFSSVQ